MSDRLADAILGSRLFHKTRAFARWFITSPNPVVRVERLLDYDMRLYQSDAPYALIPFKGGELK